VRGLRRQYRMTKGHHKYLTEQNKIDILALYEKGINTVDIGKILILSRTTVNRFLNKKGLKSNNIRKITTEDNKIIKKLYLEGKTIQYIHQNYFKDRLSEGGVNYVLRKMGITRSSGKQSNIDHSYFSIIDTEEKAYWLGFIVADGSVRHIIEKGESYVLRFELRIEDRYMVENLTKCLKSDNKVKEYYSERDMIRNSNFKKPKYNAYNSFYSKQIFEDLSKYGIVQNKTHLLNNLPTNIDNNLMKHFIRGYFDGDGTVYSYKEKGSEKVKLRFGFYGTHNYVKSIRDYLGKEADLSMNVNPYDQKEAEVSFILYTTQNNIKDFYNYTYNDATIYLTRKRRKFDDYLKK